MSEDFGHLLRVYATKTETHSNTLSARAKKLGKAGRILARMASNLHTASLLLREADARLSAPTNRRSPDFDLQKWYDGPSISAHTQAGPVG